MSNWYDRRPEGTDVKGGLDQPYINRPKEDFDPNFLERLEAFEKAISEMDATAPGADEILSRASRNDNRSFNHALLNGDFYAATTHRREDFSNDVPFRTVVDFKCGMTCG